MIRTERKVVLTVRVIVIVRAMETIINDGNSIGNSSCKQYK